MAITYEKKPVSSAVNDRLKDLGPAADRDMTTISVTKETAAMAEEVIRITSARYKSEVVRHALQMLLVASQTSANPSILRLAILDDDGNVVETLRVLL